MVNQVGVQRVISGDQNDQRALSAPTAPTSLLPERGDGARKSCQQHSVQPGDVDTQFQGVGGGQSAHRTFGQRPFDRAAVLGEIAGTIGGHCVPQMRRDVLQPRSGGEGDQFGPPPRSHEGQRPCALRHQVGQHSGRIGTRGTAHRRTVLTAQIGP